jgi:hypothetical protein
MKLARFQTPYKAPTFVNHSPSPQQIRREEAVDILFLVNIPYNPEVKLTVLKERPPGNPLNVTFNANYGDLTLLEKKD